MEYISLFSGLGGFEFGLNEFGAECILASENDKFAAKAYELLHGATPQGDVREIDSSLLPTSTDLLVAGFPCQPFSSNWSGPGFEDARGTLFFEIIRLAKKAKPRAIILENVKRLLSHDGGRTFDIMLSELNALGYSLDFAVLNSMYFDVPQSRERIFVVGLLDGPNEPFDVERLSDVVSAAKLRASQSGIRLFNFDWPKNSDVRVRLLEVLEPIYEDESKFWLQEEMYATIKAALMRGEHLDFDMDGPTVSKPYMKLVGLLDIPGYDSIRKVYRIDGVSPTLQSKYDGTREPKIVDMMRVRRITPLECFRIQGIPDDAFWTLKENGLSDTQVCKMAGNAVTVPVVREIFERLVPMLH